MINILKRQVLWQFHYASADYFDIFIIAKPELANIVMTKYTDGLANIVMTKYTDGFATNDLLGGSGFSHISNYDPTPIKFMPIEVPVLDIDYPDTDFWMRKFFCNWKTVSITGTTIGEHYKFTVWTNTNCYVVRHNNDYYLVTEGFVYLIRLSEGAFLSHTFDTKEIPIKNNQINFKYVKDLQ